MSDAQRITDIPKNERPRERMARLGPAALSDAELLAIFFRTGVPGQNAIEMGRALVEKYGGLAGLAGASVGELTRFNKGIGPAKATELLAVFEMGRRLAQARVANAPMNAPEVIYELVGRDMAALRKETVRVLCLNMRLRLIGVEEVAVGSATETLAAPMDILRPVIITGAMAFAMVHNHPSGSPTPSTADKRMTARIIEAANILGLQFIDHLIVGQPEEGQKAYFSFLEHGMVPASRPHGDSSFRDH